MSTTGTIDGDGNVRLTSTLTNGGSPRAVITFEGALTTSDPGETIAGTYSVTGPVVANPDGSEAGTFSMTHN